MDRCPNCGSKLSDIDVLCPKCGTVVEVIQIKSSTSLSSETVMEIKSNDNGNILKKDKPQNFIVYDFPPEDEEEDEEDEPETVLDEPQNASETPSQNISQNNTGTDVDVKEESPNGILSKFQQTYFDEDNDKNDFTGNEKNGFTNQIVTAKVDEDDYDYSPRYLENLKNLNLPEIDDISSFDPEEYMREYKYKKILGRQAGSGDSFAPATKQWLEIEEADPKQDAEPAIINDDAQKQEAAPVAQRRYRGTQDSRTERRQDYSTERKQDYITERKQKIARAEETEIPVKNKKSRKSNTAGMLLFWAVISVAILFSCIFLDSFIKNSYKSYDEFIFSITNGQIDIDPGKP